MIEALEVVTLEGCDSRKLGSSSEQRLSRTSHFFLCLTLGRYTVV